MKVSVIVPIYYGKKYIQPMIEQVERCRAQLDNLSQVELIIVNDAPDDSIEHSYVSGLIDIIVLNTEVNRGIQGARIHGLCMCRGEYVLLLDQDDVIYPEYLASQLKNIEKSDVSVCRALHEGKQFYNASLVFEQAVSKKYMLEDGCGIVSPGQALIRKSAISDIWKKNLLLYSGADDWLLWLCLFGEGCRFVLNQKILFEHIVDGTNASCNTERMLNSEAEVYKVLSGENVLSADELKILKNTVIKIKTKRLLIMDKFKKMFLLYNDWLQLESQKKSVELFLEEHKCCKVAIYGYGYIGKTLFEKLQNSDIEVSYVIDRNAKYIEKNILAYEMGDELPQIDAIIVTLIENEAKIVEQLINKTGAKVWTIKEVIGCISQTNYHTL